LGTVLLVVAVVVVLAVVFFAIALARRGKRQYEAQATGPGLAPNAPREWAGAHSPEAKLHRRLATASRTLSSHPLGDAAAIEQRVIIEQQILRLDQHLVAVAAVRGPDTPATIAALEPEVTSVEQAVATLATATIDPLHRNELDPGDT
jgi:hypothetical protein